ncbi:MAG TPA: T9SS type A sorting domain-containing protein [Flavobacteriales bacterium]|nr:T9SS type A sorting domain-containing protein [Flavobacteriales bacterium]
MKKNLLFFAGLFSLFTAAAQESMPIKPFSSIADISLYETNLAEVIVNAPDLTGFEVEDAAREKNGQLYRMGVTVPVDINLQNSGTWSLLANGDRVWRLKMSSPGAKGTLLFFNNFYLPAGSRMHVYSSDRTQMLGAFTSYNNHESGIFATALVKGEDCIIEYYEPIEAYGKGIISMTEFGYAYRAVHEVPSITENDNVMRAADICEVDVKCPEGTPLADQIRGVCRIQVKVGASLGWCSGSAINNTAGDCTPYILTAQHCGEGASTADFNAWKFYFNYQRSSCGSGGASSNVLTGGALIANSNDVSGGSITKSDFILLESNNVFPAAYNVYLNGWNRVNTGATNGVSVHHPAGDYKKISTFCTAATSSGWSTANTHWRVIWCATTTNWGVTEGGSSGSPLFNQSNLIVGQLSGGQSYCDGGASDPSSSTVNQDDPDVYGKFYHDWDLCGTTTNRQLKPWLDPLNTGVTSLAGRENICVIGEEEYAIENLFNMYPNPVRDMLVIESTGFNESVHNLFIYDQLGKLVISESINPGMSKKSVLVTNLEEGVYSVVISNGQRSFTRKFVKL